MKFSALHEFFVGVLPNANSTCTFADEANICLPPFEVPFYFVMRQNLFDNVPDNILALVVPIVAFWSMSLFFHCLDVSDWAWLEKYRIHGSNEVNSYNHIASSQVFRAVVLQHTLQTALGYCWLSDSPTISPSKCMAEMEAVARTLVRLIRWTVGSEVGSHFLEHRAANITYWLYWWCIPTAQLFFAFFILDTWQYFLHRWMHSNKFIYKHFHSVHHRLYVPYAFGAQYNHPLEGLLLEAVGAGLAETVANLTIRQTIFFYTFSTMKGVDDHCGYRFPFDPFQMFSDNNSDYHDIHHQAIGIKYNFSQPFFVHWDVILGTRMTRKDVEKRKRRLKTI